MLFIIQNDTVDGAQEEEAEREETKLKSKRGEKRTNTQQQQDNTQQTSSGPSVTCKSPRSDPFVSPFGLGEFMVLIALHSDLAHVHVYWFTA